jgi:ketosteroid isomerase-like protein
MAQTDENIALIQAAFADFGKGDIQTLLTRFDENAAWETPFPRDIVPYGGKRTGKAQIREFFDQLAQTTETLRFEPKEFIASGETVVVLGVFGGRVRKTGRAAESDFAMVFRIRNGKVTSYKEYTDAHVVVQAFAPQQAVGV